MANGQTPSYQNGGVLSIAMRAGKWGAVGLAFAAFGSLANFLFPNVADISDLKQFFAWGGMALGLWGLSAQSKRGTDMQATVAADSAKDRAAIVNAVVRPEIPVVPTSEDPAVQHEINRRLTK
jgi:hypothetical protein